MTYKVSQNSHPGLYRMLNEVWQEYQAPKAPPTFYQVFKCPLSEAHLHLLDEAVQKINDDDLFMIAMGRTGLDDLVIDEFEAAYPGLFEPLQQVLETFFDEGDFSSATIIAA